MAHPGKPQHLPPNTGESPNKGPQRRTFMRAGLIDRVVAEWDRRDVAAQLGALSKKGERFDSFLATLNKSEFLQVLMKVLPRQTEVNVKGGGEGLQKLLNKAKGE